MHISTDRCGVASLLGIALMGAMACGTSTTILSTDMADGGEPHVDLVDDPEADVDTNAATEAESGSDTDTKTEACPHGEIEADEVVLIGDAWISLPASHLGDLALAAGTIQSGEAYVNLAQNGVNIETIVDQYNTRQADETEVTVLIMNGGGLDLIGGEGSGESVDHVVSTFTEHLDKVDRDGTVQHVIYSLYPEIQSTPGVADLRPGMQAACRASAVPCHFLDLQPLWEGHPEYNTGSNEIIPSDKGSDVIAEAIWAIMQQNCIAQ